MNKRKIFLTMAVLTTICTSNIALAESQVNETTTTGSAKIAAEASALTTDPLYSSLISKNNLKNDLIMKENQVCKEIKEQELKNQQKVTAIAEKTKSFSMAYNKIIDDIKLLLEPVKMKEGIYDRDFSQNKVNTSGITDAEAGIYENQIKSLNLAIRALRESMKYISLESVKYHDRLTLIQNNIDIQNESIGELNKEITAVKEKKVMEWENFSQAMYKNDLKAANESFDNMLRLKDNIVKSYGKILECKKKIGEQLELIETGKKQ